MTRWPSSCTLGIYPAETERMCGTAPRSFMGDSPEWRDRQRPPVVDGCTWRLHMAAELLVWGRLALLAFSLQLRQATVTPPLLLCPGACPPSEAAVGCGLSPPRALTPCGVATVNVEGESGKRPLSSLAPGSCVWRCREPLTPLNLEHLWSFSIVILYIVEHLETAKKYKEDISLKSCLYVFFISSFLPPSPFILPSILPSMHPFIHPSSTHLPVCPSVCQSIHVSTHPPFYPSIHLSMHPCIYPLIHPSHLSIHPPVHPSIPSIHDWLMTKGQVLWDQLWSCSYSRY